jgi:hypothetical protein
MSLLEDLSDGEGSELEMKALTAFLVSLIALITVFGTYGIFATNLWALKNRK